MDIVLGQNWKGSYNFKYFLGESLFEHCLECAESVCHFKQEGIHTLWWTSCVGMRQLLAAFESAGHLCVSCDFSKDWWSQARESQGLPTLLTFPTCLLWPFLGPGVRVAGPHSLAGAMLLIDLLIYWASGVMGWGGRGGAAKVRKEQHRCLTQRSAST